MVIKPAADKIHSVALATIVSAESMIDTATNKPYATNEIRKIIAMSKQKSLTGATSEEQNIQGYVKNLVAKSPHIITAELAKIKGWTAKDPDTYVKSKKYKAFADSVNKIWHKTGTPYSIITPYDGAMPRVPGGLVLFADDNKAATTEEYKKLCQSLGVDAVAIMTVDYRYELITRLIGSNTVLPIVTMGLKVVNKYGEIAVEYNDLTTEHTSEVDVTTAFTQGFKFDSSPEKAYTSTLKRAIKEMVKKLNKEL